MWVPGIKSTWSPLAASSLTYHTHLTSPLMIFFLHQIQGPNKTTLGQQTLTPGGGIWVNENHEPPESVECCGQGNSHPFLEEIGSLAQGNRMLSLRTTSATLTSRQTDMQGYRSALTGEVTWSKGDLLTCGRKHRAWMTGICRIQEKTCGKGCDSSVLSHRLENWDRVLTLA